MKRKSSIAYPIDIIRRIFFLLSNVFLFYCCIVLNIFCVPSDNMLYKLYIGKSNPEKKISDSEMERSFKAFQEIYKKYGVKVIGAWENLEDPFENYLITAYNDATHYEETVAKMRRDETYQKVTEEGKDSREIVKVVTMRTLPGSPIE